MIDHAPIMRIPDLISELIFPGVAKHRSYKPESVYILIGAKFNDAAVFAARAHAAFDMDDLRTAASTNELFQAPFRSRLRLEVDKIDCIFDDEHPKSAAMLNEMFGS